MCLGPVAIVFSGVRVDITANVAKSQILHYFAFFFKCVRYVPVFQFMLRE